MRTKEVLLFCIVAAVVLCLSIKVLASFVTTSHNLLLELYLKYRILSACRIILLLIIPVTINSCAETLFILRKRGVLCCSLHDVRLLALPNQSKRATPKPHADVYNDNKPYKPIRL